MEQFNGLVDCICNTCILTTRAMEWSNSTTFQSSSRSAPASLLYLSLVCAGHNANGRSYNVVYVRSRGPWLTPFTKRVIQQCMSLAHDTSVQLSLRGIYDSTYPFETPAKLLQRLLNAIMSDRSGTKKDIAYFVGNQLFRCYFKVKIQYFLSALSPFRLFYVFSRYGY